jgi:serine/threonine protein phosphatase 1
MIRQIKEPKGKIIVVGDIHARFTTLCNLLDEVAKDVDIYDPDNMLVFVGDYIDRGHEHKATLNHLIDLKTNVPNTVFIRGNHEDMFLNFISPNIGMYGNMHAYNGGKEMYAEYMVPREYYRIRYSGECDLDSGYRDDFIACFPKKHLDFIRETEYCVESEHFVFCHAGIIPNNHVMTEYNCFFKYQEEEKPKKWYSLEDQTTEDFTWIREGFLGKEHKLGKTVVHGHTPCKNVYNNKEYEINVDTGAAYGKKMSAIVLEYTDKVEYKVYSVKV